MDAHLKAQISSHLDEGPNITLSFSSPAFISFGVPTRPHQEKKTQQEPRSPASPANTHGGHRGAEGSVPIRDIAGAVSYAYELLARSYWRRCEAAGGRGSVGEEEEGEGAG
jgi:hypothetical protein